MILLYELVKILLTVGALAYLGVVVYMIVSVFAKFLVPSYVRYALIAGPIILILMTGSLYGLNNWASEARYAEWTEKCGHEPVVGVTSNLAGYSRRAHLGSLAKQYSTMADGYFCTFMEADESGFQPDPLLGNRHFSEAGYTPLKADLDFINKDLPLDQKIKL